MFDRHRNNASPHARGLRELGKGIIQMFHIEYGVIFICVSLVIVPRDTVLQFSVSDYSYRA